MVLALPLVTVAVNPTGEPTSPPTVAVAESGPATVPRVRVAVAMPVGSVMDDDGVIEPPPLVTVQVTVTPLTGLLLASVTLTEYGVASVAPIVSVCAFPALRAIVVAALAVPVA